MSDVPAGAFGPASDDKVAARAWWVDYERSVEARTEPFSAPVDDNLLIEGNLSVDPLTEKILLAADRCSAARNAMDDFAEPYKNRGNAGALLLHPGFKELVARFASQFSTLSLVRLVDKT